MKKMKNTFSAYLLISLLLALSIQAVFAQESVLLAHEHTPLCRHGETSHLLSPYQTPNFQAGTVSSSSVNYARFEPFIIREGIDKTKFIVGVEDDAIVSMTAKFWKAFLLYNGQEVDEITLYDDGTHGDLVAGDKRFTLGDLSVTESVFFLRNAEMTFNYSDGSQETQDIDIGRIIIGLVKDELEIPAIAETEIEGTRFLYSEYLVQILPEYDESGFPVLYPPKELDNLNKYFQLVSDNRDFLVFFDTPHNRPNDRSPAGGFSGTANFTEGIGFPVFDWTVGVGLTRSFLGFIFLYAPSFHTFDHELLHNWIGGGKLSQLNLVTSHWDVTELHSTGFGGLAPVYGAFRELAQEADTLFRAYTETQRNDDIFNDLELYLMGLTGMDEVQDSFKTLVNPELLVLGQTDEQNRRYTLYRADSMRVVAKQEILDSLGVRVPSYLESQKEFRIYGLIYYDRPLTPVEFAFYHYFMQEYEKPRSDSQFTVKCDLRSISAAVCEARFGHWKTFHEATGGRAGVVTRQFDTVVSNELQEPLPRSFALEQNYPNPFNPITTIRYRLPVKGHVMLTVHDVLGRKVATLIDGLRNPGEHHVPFDATLFSSGVYFYTLQSGSFSQTQKLIVRK